MTSLTNSSIDVVLTNIQMGTHDVNLYTFERADGGALPAATPGAHISIKMPKGIERQYSLIVSDREPTAYTVGVKRDAGGRGGSRWIHDELRIGTRLTIDGPRNNFSLDESAETTILIAGGIGITPIYCMARRLSDLGRDFTLHYSCRTRRDAVFLRDLARLPNVRLHFDDEGHCKFLPIADILAAAPRSAHAYCCGPAPMLDAFEAAGRAAGLPQEQLHVEYFAPRDEAATAGGFAVELARSGKRIEIPEGASILQVLLDAGLDVPFGCQEGLCGSCQTVVLAGRPDHRDAVLSDSERAANDAIMICVSGSKDALLVLDL